MALLIEVKCLKRPTIAIVLSECSTKFPLAPIRIIGDSMFTRLPITKFSTLCFLDQIQRLSHFVFSCALNFCLAASNVFAQPLSLQKVGLDEQLLAVAPFQAELKQDGYVYLEESKYSVSSTRDVFGQQTPVFQGSGNTVYVKNSGASLTLSSDGIWLSHSLRSPLVNTKSLVIDEYSGQPYEETVFYKSDGSRVNVPLNDINGVVGVNGQKIYGARTRREEGVYEFYDAETDQVARVAIPTFDQLSRNEIIRANPSLAFYIVSPADPLILTPGSVEALGVFAVEDGITYGVVPPINFDARGFAASLLWSRTAPFALFADGSSMRYSGSADFLTGANVENGVIFKDSTFGTPDGVLKTALGLDHILGISTADNFGFGIGGVGYDDNILSIFSLDDGAEQAFIDIAGRVYDVDYLGDGKFTYLADIDGKLIRGQVQVVPLPAAVWLFATALFGLLSLRRMSR